MITYEMLNINSLQEVINFFSKAFLDEPINKHLNTAKKELLPITTALCNASLKAGLCAIAIDSESEKIIGTILCMDNNTSLEIEIEGTKTEVIFALLEQLNESFFPKSQEVNINDCMHLFSVVIAKNYTGKGLHRHCLR